MTSENLLPQQRKEEKMDEIELLSGLPLFSGIAEEELLPLCRTLGCRRCRYGKGAVLWSEGERVFSAGIVLSGCIRAEQNGDDGSLRVVALHRAGALFGDVLMSSQMQRSPVDIVAAEETEVLFLPLENIMRESADGLAAARTRFRLNLLGEISDKYWALYRRIGLLSAQGMRARIARYLLGERERQGTARLSLPMTRETMASLLGVNRSALSRELSRLQREGVLRLERRGIELLDMAALRAMTE